MIVSVETEDLIVPAGCLRRTFGQTQQIVGFIAVVLCLQVLIAGAADGYDDTNAVPIDLDVEFPLSVFDARNGIRLRELPSCVVVVYSTNVCYGVVWILPGLLVDAGDSMHGSHDPSTPFSVYSSRTVPRAG